MSNNPFQSPEQNPMQQPYQQMHGAPDVSGKVSGPAIGLMVVAVMNLLWSLYGVAISILMITGIVDTAAQSNEAIQELRDQGTAPAFVDMMSGLLNAQGPINLVIYLLSLIVGIIILMGAIKMKKLNSYGMAMTSSILAMIPCLSWAACCVLGVGIGIWSIIVLNDVHVKNAFRGNKS